MTRERPLVVGVGGTLRQESSSERALRSCLRAAEQAGARTECYSAAALDLPMFAPGLSARTPESERFIDAVRRADGLVIATPGYHGSISGLVKNALDYTEDLREDQRPYLEGRAVACIASAAGHQAAVTTLVAVRSVVHALRGWLTPLGVAINSRSTTFTPAGECSDPAVDAQLELAAQQVVGFAAMVLESAQPGVVVR